MYLAVYVGINLQSPKSEQTLNNLGKQGQAKF
jgi:hypothetical protein